MKRWRAGSGTAATFAVAAMIAGLSGCGGSDYTFVRDSGGGTYFKVPAAWHQVDQKQVDAAFLGDPSSATGPDDEAEGVDRRLRRSHAALHRPLHDRWAGGPNEPFAFAIVQTLTEGQKQDVSLNALRGLLNFPVTLTPAELAEKEKDKEYPYKNFELTADDVLEGDNGAKGVRMQVQPPLHGGPAADVPADELGVGRRRNACRPFLIRCSATCYQQRQAEFDSIAQSFKVKNNLG